MAKPTQTRIRDREDLKVTQAAGSLPTPSTGSDGASIETWKEGRTGPAQAFIRMRPSVNNTVTSPKLYGRHADTIWYLIGDLNNANTITLTTTVGFAQVIQLPGVFERLAVGGTVSAGTVTVDFNPTESYL
jgi:hypothetical protein